MTAPFQSGSFGRYLATVFFLIVMLTPVATVALRMLVPGEGQAPTAISDLVGRTTVLDGDTIEVRGDPARLHDINTPESGQTCPDRTERDYRCSQPLGAKE